MSLAHDIAYAAAALVTAPVWGYRLWRTGKYRTDWPARFGRCAVQPDARPTVLIHGVSVGEVNAARELVKRLVDRYGKSLRIVICTTTDTGWARARALFEPDHTVVRYPFDFGFAVRRFLDTVRPDVVVLIELELWPNFISQCKRRGIGLAVVNGRLSERSFAGYQRFRGLIGSMFGALDIAAVQSRAYADRFAAMGTPADRIEVTGTMKWDTARLVDQVEGADELADEMGIDRNRRLIVCGSTGPGEEKMLVDALGNLTDQAGQPVQLLIVPRKPERFDEAAAAMGDCVRRSDQSALPAKPANLFLLDTMGELAKAYALADVVVVGRSFCKLYGSDMMEPIALGKPTIVGPNTADFADQVQALLDGDGIIQLDGIDQLRATVEQLLATPRGRELAENGRSVILWQQGATDRHVALIEQLLSQAGKLPAAPDDG